MVRTHSRCLALLQAGQCNRVPNVPTRFFCSVALYHVSRTAILLRAEEVVEKRGTVQLDSTGLPVIQREINNSTAGHGVSQLQRQGRLPSSVEPTIPLRVVDPCGELRVGSSFIAIASCVDLRWGGD